HCAGRAPLSLSFVGARRGVHLLRPGHTSLAASADGRRLVLTLASPKRTLWRLRIADSPGAVSAAARISLTSSTGFSPRLGPDYLLYASAIGTTESIWKLADGTGTELWSGEGARVFGGPAISPDRRHIALLGAAARADAPVRDAGRRHERPDRRRLARPAGRAGMGAR